MTEIQRTFDRLTTLPLFKAERPATAEEISEIETELNVRLPVAYAEFLRRFSYVSWLGNEILGVRPMDRLTGEPSTVTSDCVSKTKEEKSPSNPFGTASLPAHIVISTDGAGGNYILFAAGSPYYEEVHYYNFEDTGDPIRVWKSLQNYLEEQINAAGE